MSWDKLTHKELLDTLENDFAFPITDTEKKTKEKTLGAIKEGGLKFADYLAAHPEDADRFREEPQKPVTGQDLAKAIDAAPQVQTAPEGEAPWLVKMERANSYFEVGNYVFTKEHPYVLVEVKDVEKVMREGGFRQAYPQELAEFYG